MEQPVAHARLLVLLGLVLLGGCQSAELLDEPFGSYAPVAPLAAPPVAGASSPEEHNLRGINAYRATLGLAPLALDARLSAFALEGSRVLARERRAHTHFRRASRGGALFRDHGFANHACENQGDPDGWPPMGSIQAQIDDILAAMWREGPGGGHYDAMANPRLKRVGIGLLVTADGRLYLTNDFSG